MWLLDSWGNREPKASTTGWFNREGHKFCSMSDSVEKLHSKMKNHFINVAPLNFSLKPVIKKVDHFLIKIVYKPMLISTIEKVSA